MPWLAGAVPELLLCDTPVFPILEPVSSSARDINLLLYQLFGLSAVIFGVTGGLIVWAMVRSARGRFDSDAVPVEGGSREIHWMIGPALVVAWLVIVSAKLILSINVMGDEIAEAPDVIARGHQWYWEFEYPESGVITANQLHIPAGRRLVLGVSSADVVHSFWAPQLGRKMDAVPGRDNAIYIEADEPGVYQGYCSEYCGTQHAWMLFEVIVHEEGAYEVWLGEQAKPARDVSTDALVVAGREAFEKHTCVLCHTVRGQNDGPEIGPDLTHLMSRTILAGGVAPLNETTLRQWLRDPEAMKPGTNMPSFKFDEGELDAIVAYLMSLQ